MEALYLPLAIGTGIFFTIRFHQQDRGWGWGLLYGLFLCPIALVHALVIIVIGAIYVDDDIDDIFKYFKYYDRGAGPYRRDDARYMKNELHPPVYVARDVTTAQRSRRRPREGAASRSARGATTAQRSRRRPRNDAASSSSRGMTLSQQSSYAIAIRDFNKKIDEMAIFEPNLCPHSSETEGITSVRRSRYDETIWGFNKAVEKITEIRTISAESSPPNDPSHYQTKSMYAEFTEDHRAIENLSIATAPHRIYPELYKAKGHIYAKLKNYGEALQCYAKSIRLRADTDAYKHRGIVYLKLGEIEKAVEDLRLATMFNPQDLPAHMYAAHALFEKSDFKNANAAFYQCISLLEDYLEKNSFKPEEEDEVTGLILKLNERYTSIEADSSPNTECAEISQFAQQDATPQDLRQIVLDILRENIHSGRNEANEDRQHMPTEAIANSTHDSLQAFFQIHLAISNLLPSDDHYRTRFVERTSTNGVGIAYYTRPIGEGAKARGMEIQSILLPVNANMSGCIESYVSGHDESPIVAFAFHNQRERNKTRDGRPVFRIIGQPSSKLTEQLINSFSKSFLFSQIQSE